MSETLDKAVQDLLPKGQKLRSLEKLFGEASYREYFRIFTEQGPCYVLMKIPAGKQSVSEEITNYEGPKDELPFLNIARYLNEKKIPTPQVLDTDLSQGLILLQDLGDQSFEKLLENCNETMRLFFYRQALDLLVQFQLTGEQHPDKDCMAFNRSFDATLLEWEFEHFLEYGIEDRFSLKIPEGERGEMLKLGQELVSKIVEIPYGLTHRDFQSRNLMLHGYQFYLIDFQDALQGPPQYDLVALLRDSYVKLPQKTVDFLIDSYLKKRRKAGLPELEPDKFKKDFYRITLQRKLKDAGRFQFIHTAKKNSKFLTHVPDTLAYIKAAFGEVPEYEPLRQLIAKYVPELK